MLAGMLAVLMIAQAPPEGRRLSPCPPAAVIPRTPDGVVLGTIGAIDANALEAAALAATKASSRAVRDLAKLLVKDHDASLEQGTRLAKRFGIVRLLPADSAMERQHKAAMYQLNTLTGAAFDQAFVETSRNDHRTILRIVRGTLLPLAVRPDVKEFVNSLVPRVVAHLAAEEQWLAEHP